MRSTLSFSGGLSGSNGETESKGERVRFPRQEVEVPEGQTPLGASSLPLPIFDGARCSSVGSDLFPTWLPSAGGFSREHQVSHLFVSRGP